MQPIAIRCWPAAAAFSRIPINAFRRCAVYSVAILVLVIPMLSANLFIAPSLLLLVILSLHVSAILMLHLAYRRRGLAEERALFERPPPPPDRLPHVLVQLPILNERHVVMRVIESAAMIDWPSDRLEIQVLDDSTDDTTLIARRTIERLRARGIQISLERRPDRSGFKAGALQYGLAKSDAEFVAIFDADFLPPRDFLRRSILPLMDDPQLGLVQTRWDHLNARESLLTRAQALQLDAHFVVEQSARAWFGLNMPFNGTCGLWRRRAIDDAGGWHSDTLTEDLDLSYRVHLKGWRAMILLGAGVPGELPSDLAAWRAQQHRWNKGFAQCARQLLRPVWRSGFPWWRKLAAICHLSQCCFPPLVALTLANAIVSLLLARRQPWCLQVLSLAATALAISSTLATTWVAQRHLRRTRGLAFLAAYLAALALNAGLAFANSKAVLEGLLGIASAFARTPKRGSAAHSAYRAAAPTGLPELAFGAFAIVTLVLHLSWSVPFLFVPLAGFLWVGLGFGTTHLRQARAALDHPSLRRAS